MNRPTHRTGVANKPSTPYFLLPTPYSLFLAPLLGYIVVSLIATWPMVTHLRGWVPGFGDWGQNLWALWWTRRALLALAQSPFFTNYLFYPEGVTLLFHPLDVSDGLLSIPLYGLLGGDATYNVIVLLSFVLGGWGTYLLALYLTQNRGASFVAGLIFALSPYHFLRIELGHLNLSTIQWIPFYTLFLFKFVRQGCRRSAVLAVFFLIFNALNSWYYVIYCGLLSLAIIFWPAKNQAAGFQAGLRRARRIGVVLGGGVILLSPLLLPMFQLLSTTTLVGAHNPLRHSVDLLSFWVPGPPSTWAGRFEEVWISYAAQNREPGASAYLGYTILGLSIVGLVGKRWRKQARWWLAVALGVTLLALGPQLQIDGQIPGIPLPYRLLAHIVPLFSITGIPGRFVVMTSLALAVLSAYGLATSTGGLQSKAIQRAGGPARDLPPRSLVYLHVVVALLVGLEYLAIPLRLTQTDVADFYHTMASESETYTLIDIKWDANFLMHAQTVHGKPLVGGWLARLPESQAAYLDQGGLDRAFLYLLLGPAGTRLADPAALRQAIHLALAARNVRYIIDHDRVAQPWLEKFVGWPAVYEEDDLVVYGAGFNKCHYC